MAQQRRSGGSKAAGSRPSTARKGGASGPSATSGRRSSPEAGDLSRKALVDLVGQRIVDQLGVVMLTKERIEETVGDAVSRGRVTADDAQALVASLVELGRRQTGDLLADIEQVIDKSMQEIESGAKRARRRGEDAARRARQQVDEAKTLARRQTDPLASRADKARKAPARAGDLPIHGYEELTAAQVKGKLDGLSTTELRAVRDYERRHANRKSVLQAVEKQLG